MPVRLKCTITISFGTGGKLFSGLLNTEYKRVKIHFSSFDLIGILRYKKISKILIMEK